MVCSYNKTGKSQTKQYKAEYMRNWRMRTKSKECVIENNYIYWRKKYIELVEKRKQQQEQQQEQQQDKE